MTKNKLVHNTKTSLREEAKEYLPTVKEFYPHLDDLLLDRISKYCVVYSKGKDKASIRQAINNWEEVFDTELQSQEDTMRINLNEFLTDEDIHALWKIAGRVIDSGAIMDNQDYEISLSLLTEDQSS